MARFGSSSSRSRWSSRWSSRSSSISTVPLSTYSALSGKRSPSACDEVAVRYPNGGSKVFYHSNFRASAIGRGISDEQCQWLLRAVVELSLFGGPDDPEFKDFRGCLRKECGIEVDVENGSSKNDSTCTSSAQD
ncbi:hypothetical protein D8674_004822 [Pyrus ussuriensis x Pyrus communis]|uniref:Uncharacterized protein n=1 Tax=Pyrus ussuriensis x Pyrus communis TaxID=2448454 RepID=A0A5N5FPT4_9ROSA|nr:hypothetical protein D8674_004822 [Pyrus ussuriensis x Pyrus communis]